MGSVVSIRESAAPTGGGRNGNDRVSPTPGSVARIVRSAPPGKSLHDAQILGAMQHGDAASYEAFVERFHRLLLDYARRAGMQAGDSDDFVDELLNDIAMQFMTPGAPIPEHPRMYVIAAFRHKFLNHIRGQDRRERAVHAAVREAGVEVRDGPGGSPEPMIGCSVSAIQASRGVDAEGASASHALERLAQRLDAELTPEERQLLAAAAEHVPQREVAQWLGVSHVVARKRLERLRARLVTVALAYVETAAPHDARELDRLLRRCGAYVERERTAITRAGAGEGTRSSETGSAR